MLTGHKIMGYVLERKLGKGGMGEVYLGVQPALGQRVAVKILDPVLARNAELRERFIQEARIQVKLRHPGIVQVHTADTEGEPLALILEYVEGSTLDSLLRKQGRLPLGEALPIFRQVLDAVEHAHEAGVVHRDLKPPNIMVAAGTAKVMDFGIAKVLGGTKLTRTGTTMGSAHYMSPEQVLGSKQLDHRTDIYSLGATFYEVLAGQPPFAAMASEATDSIFSIMEAHVRKEPPDPRERAPDLPEAVAALLLRCLAKKPAARYQSASELRAALLDLVDAAAADAHDPPRSGEAPTFLDTRAVSPEEAAPRSPPPDASSASPRTIAPAPRPVARKRSAAIGLAAALLVVGSVGLLLWKRSGSEAGHPGPPPPTPSPAAAPAPAPAPAPSPAPSPAPDASAKTITNDKDGSVLVLVAAGSFLRGSAAGEGEGEGEGDERPQRSMHLDAFYIDKQEVTVARYRKCVRAGTCTAPDTGGYCNWGKSDREDHPVNCVNWEQARRYCAWAGGRLPSEAEWEKAARGTDGRRYPWGSEGATCARAVMAAAGCWKDRTWPVGSKPSGDSPCGAQDMAGNVWEWVNDWYGKDYYASSPARNPPGPSSGNWRVVRGGSWIEFAGSVRAAYRFYSSPPAFRFNHVVGFRCARTR
jgi:serine/threonine protein kinase